ncbi:hypothetical protein DLR11_13105 [Salmonella enterica subsp. salamae]|uniref:Uncharacterized protein n=3 Tax=Salmonella enterica TaxID=28901 RepID=A0A379QLS0_SALER|nr:hypothetical protein [Salmonella enterica]ECC1481071.1 hypothetical protein [Salmonella enterica subsp. salamae]EHM1751598.1 hypothetical protein [Salmonella enterica subsp. salamae serovar 40:c:e,n,x,z15]HCM1914532.1 hypothetical protein [Salmonella enterica subsp. salamae serovar 28:r:e,n,z15]HCM2000440.1 hypothetical protein [Salmonella enterica subsp. salamae serovar [1],40:z35:e,n,x,z15]ASG88718.1 hypothetical protein LFZ47_14745 [Salmonella enterica subsp. salamae serovar 55:k:z39 str
MKSMTVLSIAALTMAVMSGVANAAISETQTWKMVNDRIQNTSNGQTLCMTGVAFQQATMEVCGSNPEMQNIRQVTFALNGALRLDAHPDYGYAPLGGKVYVREYNPLGSNWDYIQGQLKKTDSDNVIKCLDIEGGKNVKGAKLYLATCTK